MSGDSVSFEYFEAIIGGFCTVLAILWLGVTWRVYMNNERRLVALEHYFDPRNEEMRKKLLIAEFQQLVSELELRQARDLENKRASIESTIKQQVSEVVKAVKNGG